MINLHKTKKVVPVASITPGSNNNTTIKKVVKKAAAPTAQQNVVTTTKKILEKQTAPIVAPFKATEKTQTTPVPTGTKETVGTTAGTTSIPPTLTPYRFTFRKEKGLKPGKGDKALVRFRDNLRKFYPQCNLTEGLLVKDSPILELFCYDPETDVGYCRLFSDRHEGPLFASPKTLYETYNCSSQGHPDDVFVYSAEGDEDHGMELIKFLRTNEILQPHSFPEQYQTFFKEQVEKNVLIKAYPKALEEKRAKKAIEMDNKKNKTDDVNLEEANPEKGEEKQDEEEDKPEENAQKEGQDEQEEESRSTKKPSVTTAVKKRMGRPKGVSKTESSVTVTKKQKTNTSPSSSSNNATNVKDTVNNGINNAANFGFTYLENVQVDFSDLKQSTGTFVYGKRENVRLVDLPRESVERAAMCWNILSIMRPDNVDGLQTILQMAKDNDNNNESASEEQVEDMDEEDI